MAVFDDDGLTEPDEVDDNLFPMISR